MINQGESADFEEWNMILENRMGERQSAAVYGPYLTSRWNQSESNDGLDKNAYNYHVGEQCGENNCAAGCVPVAMAQIMNYWKYPVMTSLSARHYDWCNMPDGLYTGSQNYEWERNAISTLIQDCGAFADVSYCFSGCQSFAWPSKARKAFVDDFHYDKSADLIRRIYHIRTWKKIIKANITNGRPVFYAAMEDNVFSGGHAFVCDGYDGSTDKFHFNWGWGNQGTWVTLDDLNSGNGGWNNLERAIVNLFPIETQNYCDFTLPLELHYYLYYNVSGNLTPPPYQNVPRTATKLISVSNNINYPDSWRTIPSGASSEYVAHKEIVLRDGFEAKHGCSFRAYLVPCHSCENNRTDDPMAGGEESYVFVEQSNSQEGEREGVEENPSGQETAAGIVLYPNPTTGELNVRLDASQGGLAQLSIMDMLGNTVMQRKGCESERIDVSGLAPGLYLIHAVSDKGQTYFSKFVKQ